MERGVILMAAALMAFVAPGIQGTSHLSFANNTEVNITRAGCQVTKLCMGTPDDCDPAGNGTCQFGSVTPNINEFPLNVNLSMELRGESKGYIAMGFTLKTNQETTVVFVCAKNSSDNGTFFFRTAMTNGTNNPLTSVEAKVTDISGTVTGDVIRCEFKVPSVTPPTTRNILGTAFVFLATGDVDGNNLGPLNVNLRLGPLNITDQSGNNFTTVAPTTMNSTNTTSGANSVLHPQALLLLSILMLSVMLRA